VRVPSIASVLEIFENDIRLGGRDYWIEPTPYATRLFRGYPTVREVVPVDRVPDGLVRLRNAQGYAWYHNPFATDGPGNNLPDFVFRQLKGGKSVVRPDYDMMLYPTTEAAVAALGQAVADLLRAKCKELPSAQ
jgi:hypothetical protein